MGEETRRLAIIGAGGHGKVAADIAALNGYGEIVFLDDDGALRHCGRYPVVGKSTEASRMGWPLFVAIGNPETRSRIMGRVGHTVTLIHPHAVIAEGVVIGEGTVVMAGAVINPGTVIGKGAIINTCSSVDHDCLIGEFVHVAVGAHIAGNVKVGNRTWIGAGATVSNNVCICGDVVIGAGAVVIRDICRPGVYVGVPAKERLTN